LTKTDDASVHAPAKTGGDNATAPAPQMCNVLRLWRYRRVLLAAALLGVVLTGAAYFTSPVGHAASVRFNLMFRGTETGTYPSGARFSTEDIIAPAALSDVHTQNDLARFVPFEQFQHAFHVAPKPSPGLVALDALYAGKLANRKLTAVELKHLEREYQAKRDALLHTVSYELTMDLSPHLAPLPDDLHEKVLRDVLKTWAVQAVKLKGALTYQLRVMTPRALPPTVLDAPPLVAADTLRLKTRLILDTVDALAELPGARTFRPADDKLTLDETRSNLNDLARTILLPTIHEICLAPPSAAQRQQARTYLQSALADARRSLEQAAHTTEAIKDAFALTQGVKPVSPAPDGGQPPVTTPATTVIPQLGESFIDRLLDMAAESEAKNALARQTFAHRLAAATLTEAKLAREARFYEDALEAVQAAMTEDDPLESQPGEQTAVLTKRLASAHAALVSHLEQINALHTQLSKTNLNPPAELYAAPQPALTNRVRAITTTSLALTLIALVAALVFLTSIACLYHDRLRTP